MKVKAGVAQPEEAAALPASVNPFVCFDISALSNLARDFRALKNTRQEGLECCHLPSPFNLALSHVQGSCCSSPCSLQPCFWATRELLSQSCWNCSSLLRGECSCEDWAGFEELTAYSSKRNREGLHWNKQRWSVNEWRQSLKRLELLKTYITRSTLFQEKKKTKKPKPGEEMDK